MKVKKIEQILRDAEVKLQGLIASSAENGDYAVIDLARRYAIQLHEMQNGLNQSNSPKNKLDIITHHNTMTKSAKTPLDKKTKGKKTQYPKFKITSNSLIRIGWSKKEKREYSHKASKIIYDLTIDAMEKISNTAAGPFMAENIIDKLNKNSDQSIPAYQVYVVIGYLKDQGYIQQIGRDGYNIPPDIKKKSMASWL